MLKNKICKVLGLLVNAIPESCSTVANQLLKYIRKYAVGVIDVNRYNCLNSLVITEDSCAEFTRLYNCTKHLKVNLESTDDRKHLSFKAKVRIGRILRKINMDLDGKTVLDIGCGEGIELAEIRKLFPKAKCYGIDISKNCERGCFKYIQASSSSIPLENIYR